MGHQTGWKVVFAAGAIPFTVGLGGYLTAFVMSTVLHPDQPYRVLWQVSTFTIDGLFAFHPDAGGFFAVLSLTFWQLLVVFGATVCTVSYHGLRTGQRWSWYFLAAALTWAAGNDTAAAVYLYVNDVMVIPTPLLVDLLGMSGLFLSRDVLSEPA